MAAAAAVCGAPAGAAAAHLVAAQHGFAGRLAGLHRQLHPADSMYIQRTPAGRLQCAQWQVVVHTRSPQAGQVPQTLKKRLYQVCTCITAD